MSMEEGFSGGKICIRVGASRCVGNMKNQFSARLLLPQVGSCAKSQMHATCNCTAGDMILAAGAKGLVFFFSQHP